MKVTHEFTFTEIVSYFNQNLENGPEMSDAVAAIRTLIEVIKRKPGL